MSKSKEMISILENQIEQLCKEMEEGHTEGFKKYLEVASKFRRYSFGNLMLIYCQRPDATRVAGFNTWKSLGRSVKKGEKSIKILAPIPFKMNREKDDGSVVEQNGLYFRAVSVFDISQTEGKDVPSFSEHEGLLGDDKLGLYEKLKAIMNEKGIVVEEKKIPGGALGVSYGGRVEIDPDLAPKGKVTTLIHEFAHELLKHSSENKDLTREVKECQAESVTYVVTSYFGEKSEMSRDYILNWKNTPKTLREQVSAILKAAAIIIDALEESLSLKKEEDRNEAPETQTELAA